MDTLFVNKEELVNFYRAQLSSNINAIIEGLLHVYGNQTAGEQLTKSTNLFNGVGFTGADARFCSTAAKIILFRMKRGFITEKQKSLLERIAPRVCKAMPKYARQIVEDLIKNGKIIKVGSCYGFAK